MNNYVVKVYYNGKEIETVWVSTVDEETALDSACCCCMDDWDKYGIDEDCNPEKLTAKIIKD